MSKHFIIPTQVVNEFELAHATLSIVYNAAVEREPAVTPLSDHDLAAVLAERAGVYPSAMAHREVIKRVLPDLNKESVDWLTESLCSASNAISAGTANFLVWIAANVDGGIDFDQLLSGGYLPFQVFTVDGVALETRVSRATDGSGAYDILAKEDIVVTSKAQLIGLGFKSRMDHRECAILLPRSSYGAKWGFALANTVGLIDSDYPDEWMAKIYLNGIDGINDEGLELKIPKGERLAQFLITEAKHPLMVQVTDETQLRPTGRTGGFGSTNIHK